MAEAARVRLSAESVRVVVMVCGAGRGVGRGRALVVLVQNWRRSDNALSEDHNGDGFLRDGG